MDDSFVWPQPAKLWMLSQSPREATELCHEFFNPSADEFFPECLDNLADDLIARPERQYDSGAKQVVSAVQQRRCEGILRAGVHRVRPCSLLQRKTYIANFQRNDPVLGHETVVTFEAIEYSRALNDAQSSDLIRSLGSTS